MNTCKITIKASQWGSVRIRENEAIWIIDRFQAVAQCVLSHENQEVMVELKGSVHDLDNIENLILDAHFETGASTVTLLLSSTEKAEVIINGKVVTDFPGEDYEVLF